MLKRLGIGFMLIIFISMYFQCSDDENCVEPGNGTDGEPSFASDIQPIFSASCAISGCHDATTASAELVLTEGQAYAQLVDVLSTQDAGKKLVTPGDAENSYLVMKLEDRASVGSAMPLGSTLSDEEIQRIRDWIDAGAEDN
ncbi:MAG: hypothetical protein JSV84_14465 [Gemmatimonadota bacterium]|nr:MAG: hypothetical protein JSV84_14465 [Gemmatimonadota bacterium]